MRALFLDRDGVINKDLGHVHRVEDFVFSDGIFDVIQEFTSKNFAILVVTNQAGIAKGFYTEENFADLTRWMIEEFKSKNVEILDVLYCPHHPKGKVPELSIDCSCRKPLPGLFQVALKQHGISPKESVMIGDRESDMEAAAKAGLGTRILLSGQDSVHATHRFLDLMGLSDYLKENNPRW
jgi:D-glycero-D-manno-heptose 1,7-bisphosphate phosphatase